MILAIDTGNTNIVLGCIENRKIRAVAVSPMALPDFISTFVPESSSAMSRFPVSSG